jgi:2,3-dihydroxyphenylpropionate 1,2-dioxygenase
MLLDHVPGVGEIREEWDDEFLRLFTAGDLTVFDAWTDAEVLREGGNGAGEVRQWIAAAAAAQKAGAGPITVDYYSHGLPMGVASVVVHA